MKNLAFLIGLFSLSLHAQTNNFVVHTNFQLVTVTNWVQPGHGFVLLNNQLYDSRQFTTLDNGPMI